MKIMSVDIGDARTGIAICDKTEFLASPVGVIYERNKERLVEKIAAAAAEQKAEMIVVGLPLNMDGTKGDKALLCEEMAEKIAEKTSLPVHLWDERRSTVEAHNILTDSGVFGKKRKGTVDAVAATLILEGFLAFRKNNK